MFCEYFLAAACANSGCLGAKSLGRLTSRRYGHQGDCLKRVHREGPPSTILVATPSVAEMIDDPEPDHPAVVLF